MDGIQVFSASNLNDVEYSNVAASVRMVPTRQAGLRLRPTAWAEKKGDAQIAELLQKWQKSP